MNTTPNLELVMVSPNCAMLLRGLRRQYSFAADVPAITRQALGRFKRAVALGTRLPAPEEKSEIMFKREAGHPVIILHAVILDTRRQRLPRRTPETHHPLS